MSQDSAQLVKTLARLQALFLDAVSPLATLVEESEKNLLLVDRAGTAAKTAVCFLCNASIQMARERRRTAILEMNRKLMELAEKYAMYEGASLETSSLRRQKRGGEQL